MNWEALGSIGEIIGAFGVIATLLYLAHQVRENNRALSAQSRHSLSEFVLKITLFHTEHADRYARLKNAEELTEGDREFLFWSHMQLTLHAETYFHHVELGLMPESHWRGYKRYWEQHILDPGFVEFWSQVGPGFSENFRKWLDEQIAGQGLRPPEPHHDG